MKVSLFCKISECSVRPYPKKYYSQIANNDIFNLYSYGNTAQSNNRTYNIWNNYQNVFTTNDKTYDAFDVDIATVDIYFQRSSESVIQMYRQATMTWVDYLSNVGGFIGLVLGMGFVSIVELFWLCIRLMARSWDLTFWIT